MSDPNFVEISKTLASASSMPSIECKAYLKTEIVYGQTNIAVILTVRSPPIFTWN